MPPIYVLDTSSFRIFGNYYPESFPTFWDQLNALVAAGRLDSVREVKKELDFQSVSVHLDAWIAANSSLFRAPTEEEMYTVAEIFAVGHFRQLIGEKTAPAGPTCG